MNFAMQLALLTLLQGPNTAIDQSCQQEIDKGNVPGFSVAVVQNGEIIHMAGYGLADIENQILAKPETSYRVGSVTKQFCAFAIQILEEQGRLSLQDLLSDRLPPFPTEKKIRIRHLLTHTAGLQKFDKMKLPRLEPGNLPTSEEIIGLLGSGTLAFEPGEQFVYGNPQYVLASLVIEAISGLNFADFLYERIFSPLEMNTTKIGPAGDSLPHHAVGYKKNQTTKDWKPAPIAALLLAKGAGAMTTTVQDMAKWAQALQARKFLSPEGYRKMATRVTLNDGTKADYGLGWRLSDHRGQPLVAHGGGTSGFSGYIGRLVESRLTIIILANGDKSGGRKLFNKIASVVLD
jgi:CubicO group peptidase (beta-lactamase class C family)